VKKWILLVSFSLFLFFPPNTEATQDDRVVEMKVKKVMVDSSIKSPTAVVILESTEEEKYIPIWIGQPEATSIAIELDHVAVPRPNSHDLIRNIIQGVGVTLNRITITDLRNNVYYAELTLNLNGEEFQIDSRPSDAIAVALRLKAPIYASSLVLARARQLPQSRGQKDGFRKILGIHAQTLTLELAGLFNLKVKKGVLVAKVEQGSAASNAGIERGDVILEVNNRKIQRVSDLHSFFRRTPRPVQVKMKVLKKGKTATLILDLPS